MTATQKIDVVVLPLTQAAIRREFPGRDNAGLRAEILATAKRTGNVGGIARRIALNVHVHASLEIVQTVLTEEWAKGEYDRCYVGEGDPSLYGKGVTVAYRDQAP